VIRRKERERKKKNCDGRDRRKLISMLCAYHLVCQFDSFWCCAGPIYFPAVLTAALGNKIDEMANFYGLELSTQK
jgi:hypothetical protein